MSDVSLSGRVHMVGVCGVGMAGVAYLLRQRGAEVSGCDLVLGRQAGWLERHGVPVSTPHAAAHVRAGVDWVIRSTAVSPDSDEIRAAEARGIPVLRRGEVLPMLIEGCESVAVAGTHGKTTTAAVLVQLLRGAGCAPSWCIGGDNHALGGVAGAGGEGALVVEADESDGTLALYHPDIAVITNVEFDHMEHFRSEQDFEACFERFLAQTRRRVWYCADDPRAARLCRDRPMAIGYGFSEAAALRCYAVTSRSPQNGLKGGGGRTRYAVVHGAEMLGEIEVPFPGRHNVLNTLAAIGVCLDLGVPFHAIAQAVSAVMLPRRRFEVVARDAGVTVVSDYAHHPSEIAALIAMTREQHAGRLTAVFQPHRYTRTEALGADFPDAFAGVDQLVLTPVYPASEVPLAGGRVSDLYAHFRRDASLQPLLARSLEQAQAFLERNLRDGDWLLVIGAGDVERIGTWWQQGDRSAGLELSEVSEVRAGAPVGDKTVYGIGGAADLWVALGCVEDLAATLRWCYARSEPFCVLGAGSNVLVSDLGVRGVVARLTGKPFRIMREHRGEVVVGGGVPLAALQRWAIREGWAGLTFLEGIPGTMGGLVRMNGGAYGHSIGERVKWIRGLRPDGSECIVDASTLEWGYRECPSLPPMVIIDVGLRLKRGDPDALATECGRIAEVRSWMRGVRCCGSVFRNPVDDYAGRLLESVGLKGVRIGGAQVSEHHANVVIAERGASASDVLALMQHMAAVVEDATGVALVREVIFLE